MKKDELVKAIKFGASKTLIRLKKRSPEICMGVGIIGFVTTVVVACKATTKIDDILDDAKEKIEKIHEYNDNEEQAEKTGYTEEDHKKDLVIIYAQTGLKLGKLYAPALAIGVLSIGSFVGSHYILQKRNFALAAAYLGIDKSFKQYRHNVVERFGEDVDKELRFGAQTKSFEETVVNDNGKEKKKNVSVNVIEGVEYSDYAKIFDESNPNFEKDSQYNLMFLRSQERWANDKLVATGYLFLNDVYEALGFPKTKAGQIIGWVYKENNPVGDNYVDFGLSELNRETVREFINGYERCIVLDFNVDGYILDNI